MDTGFLCNLEKEIGMKFFTLLLFSSAAMAQAPQSLDARLAALDSAVKSAQSAGDNALMLTSVALVLLMTGPGLALLYVGLVRPQKLLCTMMAGFLLIAFITMRLAVICFQLWSS